MTVFLIVFFAVLILGAIAAWFFVGPDDTSHDQMRRAGQSGDVSPDEAARRAMGRGPTSPRRDGGAP